MPNSIRSVTCPASAHTVIPSRPKMFGAHAVANPSTSAYRACSITSGNSAGLPDNSPIPIPIFMAGLPGQDPPDRRGIYKRGGFQAATMPTRKAIPNRANRPTGTDPVAVQRRIKRFVSILTLLIAHSLTTLQRRDPPK